MIDLRFRVFIPSRAVIVPVGPAGDAGYDGDNRDFSYDQGTSRADVWVDVDNSPFTQTPITVKLRAFGRSAQYAKDKLIDVGGKPFWWKAVKKDPFGLFELAPDAVATLAVTDSNLVVSGKLEPGPFGVVPNIRVSIHVNATLPLDPLAPGIDCDLDVLIAATATKLFSFEVKGLHDPFPAYELYLEQRRIYEFHPLQAGTSPLDLASQAGVPINVPLSAFV